MSRKKVGSLYEFRFGAGGVYISVDLLSRSSARLIALLIELGKEFPKLSIMRKDEVWWEVVLGWILCVFSLFTQRSYVEGMTTSWWGDRIHLSSNLLARLKYEELYVTLRHERIHLRQYRDKGPLWVLWNYVWPPIIRTNRAAVIELPAYVETLRARNELKLSIDDEWTKSYWLKIFTGPGYLWMNTNKGQVMEWFNNAVAEIKRESSGEK